MKKITTLWRWQTYRSAAAPLLLALLLLLVRALTATPDGGSIRVAVVRGGTDPWLALATLEGLGPPLARRVVLYRETVSPVTGPATLRRVPGIGNLRVHAWHRWIQNADDDAPTPR